MSKGFIFSLSASFLWSLAIILTRFIQKSEPNAYNIIFWTSILSFPYWVILFIKQKEEIKKLQKKDYLILGSIGIISGLFVSVFEFLALKYSPAANFSFLYRSVTIFTIVFAFLFLKEKITRKKLLLVILILIGSYFFTTNGAIITITKGDIYTILMAIFAAFGNNVLGKMATNRMSTDLSVSGGILFGFLPLMIFVYFKQAIFFPKNIFLILILVIFSISIEQLRYKAYKYSNASFVSLVFSLTPVFVSVISFILLKEFLTPFQIVGGLIIISAGIFVEKLKI